MPQRTAGPGSPSRAPLTDVGVVDEPVTTWESPSPAGRRRRAAAGPRARRPSRRCRRAEPRAAVRSTRSPPRAATSRGPRGRGRASGSPQRRALRFVLWLLLGSLLACGGVVAGSVYFVSGLFGLRSSEAPPEAVAAPEQAPLSAPAELAVSPAAEADRATIEQSLAQQRATLETLCGIAPDTAVSLRLVVEPSGAVRSVQAASAGDKAACVADQLAGGTVAWTGEGPVALDVDLQW